MGKPARESKRQRAQLAPPPRERQGRFDRLAQRMRESARQRARQAADAQELAGWESDRDWPVDDGDD